MSQAAGANAQIIYQAEAAFGVTNPSPDAIMLPFLPGESLEEKRNLVKSNVIRSNRNPQKPTRGNRDVSGSIPLELNPFMGVLLHHLMGANATTGAGSNKTHTMKHGALPAGLTIEKGFLDLTVPKYFLYNGCRINKGSFEITPEGPLPATLDFIGQKETVGGASFDATPTDYGHLGWDMSEVVMLEGGGALSNAAMVKFDVTNNCDGGMFVIGGGGLRRAIPEGSVLVEGILTAIFEDMVLLQKAIDHTETSITATLTRGTGDGSAGNEYLQFLMQELVYGKISPLIKTDKGILLELPFSAFYDNGSEASALEVTVKNTQAAV
jgi:hypothetical protein